MVYEDFKYEYWVDPIDPNDPNPAYRHTHGNPIEMHAVMIIGWIGTPIGAWICQNSWGSHAGPYGDGSFLIRWHDHQDNLEMGMANFYPIMIRD